ncbi:DUF1772 domain-containing protein [Pseudonocardia pini]|uniref:DUF1772 domain-containing protein n=1 Tax=Pseudonocardia pini TaxID=2758030 RepID=UPI0015F0DD8A|nr:DUF1772 domain-containing protein [Pseudonocardia pini]
METLAVVTVVVVGLLVGVELSVAAVVNPILDRLPDGVGLLGRVDGGRRLGRAMPFWYIGSVGLAGVWTVLAWSTPVLVAVALLLVGVVMSVALLVPINNRVIRWSAGERPADWARQIGRWDRLHRVRVAVIVAAFVLLVVAR